MQQHVPVQLHMNLLATLWHSCRCAVQYAFCSAAQDQHAVAPHPACHACPHSGTLRIPHPASHAACIQSRWCCMQCCPSYCCCSAMPESATCACSSAEHNDVLTKSQVWLDPAMTIYMQLAHRVIPCSPVFYKKLSAVLAAAPTLCMSLPDAACRITYTTTSAAASLTYSHSALSSSSARCSARCSFSIHLSRSTPISWQTLLPRCWALSWRSASASWPLAGPLDCLRGLLTLLAVTCPCELVCRFTSKVVQIRKRQGLHVARNHFKS